jgi:hypothetical protein
MEIAYNLIHVYQMCDSSESASLEQIIGELFKENKENQVVACLWTIANGPVLGEGGAGPSGALHILSMAGKFQSDIITAAKVRVIVQISLQPTLSTLSGAPERVPTGAATVSLETLKAACKCLQVCQGAITTQITKDEEMLSTLEDCAPALRDILMGAFCDDDEIITRQWFSVCEESMHALFHTHPSPDKVLASIIGPLFATLSGSLSPDQPEAPTKVFCSAARLARLLFVLGQGALCTLVYTEKLADLAKKTADKKPSTAVSQGSFIHVCVYV